MSGRARTSYSLDQYPHLKIGSWIVLDEYDKLPSKLPSSYPADSALTKEDAETLRSILGSFWTRDPNLGRNELNNTFPFFRVTSFGVKAVREGDTYFISDTKVFEQQVKTYIPNIDDISILYLKESFQAFRSGCLISSAVMLGVTAEHLFQLLLDQLMPDPRFSSINQQKNILKKIEKFKSIIANDRASFPQDVRESFDTQFLGIQSIIRIYRNESGHPTGKVIDREQAFVNLRLFIPFGKMVHYLMNHYKSTIDIL